MGRGTAVLVVLFALLLQPAISIYAQEGPTDADLKAGYCVNVIQDGDAWAQVCQPVTSIPN